MNGLTVLVVEDDAAISGLVAAVLERQGYEVFCAPTGLEAVETGRRQHGRIDLLLTDMILKNESGATVAAQIRELAPCVKVLFMSGFPLDLLIERRLVEPYILKDRSFSFLQKPFLPDGLLSAVERALTAAARPDVERILTWGADSNARTAY